MNAKWLLIAVIGTALMVYPLEGVKQPSLDQRNHDTRHSACSQTGAFNHSGVEPYDPFGLCPGGQDRNFYASRDLPHEGRRP
jgi:hypothetical protein